MKSNRFYRFKHASLHLATVILFAVLMVTMFTSCNNVKKLQYLQGPFDTTQLSKVRFSEPVIQKGDLLNIIVYSDNPQATAIYNQPIANPAANVTQGAAPMGGSGQSSFTGYLVDPAGNIQFQGIGALHIEGLTKPQLAELLRNKLEPFLQNPYFNIRFLNYKITIMGDVARPAVYSIPAERINILEAIALAGDLNVTARRDNVLVIREQNGKREFGRLDLKKTDLFNSPYFQLQQNDIVYVDLTKNKAAVYNEATFRNVSFAAGLISTLGIIITIIRN